MTDELEYLANYKTNMIYIHPVEGKGTFFTLVDEQTTKKVKIVMKAFYSEKKEEITEINIFRLKHRRGSWVYEDDNPEDRGVRIDVSSMLRFKKFINIINELDLKNLKKEKILLDKTNDNSQIIQFLESQQGKKISEELIATGEPIFRSFSMAINCALIKKQCDEFERLLSDFDGYKAEYISKYQLKDQPGMEYIFQNFFERNPWVFGVSVCVCGLDKITKKLENPTTGSSTTSNGHRVDGFMRTKANMSQVAFIEIKTPLTPLLETKADRAGCWPMSKELTAAITQSQISVRDFVTKEGKTPQINNRIPYNEDEKNIYNIYPKSYVIIGDLNQIKKSKEDDILNKFTCFEMYRNSLHTPEVLTYDEILGRIKIIVNMMTEKSV